MDYYWLIKPELLNKLSEHFMPCLAKLIVVSSLAIDHSGSRIDPSEGHQVCSLSWSPSANRFLCVTGSAQAKIYDRDGLTMGEFMKGDTYIRDRKNTKGHITGLKCVHCGRLIHARLCDMCRTSINYVKKVCQRAGTNMSVETKPVFSELKLNVLMMMIGGKRYYGLFTTLQPMKIVHGNSVVSFAMAVNI
ncbi:hypothetical protein Tco_1004142, partial [Tanacetum coccineum]